MLVLDYKYFFSRHLLQLHHDDGGEQRGVDGGGAQLPPQDRGDPRDADVGGWHRFTTQSQMWSQVLS